MRPDLLGRRAGRRRRRRARGRCSSPSAPGSTNTGAIDPLPELAEIARRHGAWLHVDAAYGGFAALTERGRGWLRGIELADSVTLDPHKWLYQPFECGCLLVREGERLRRAFTLTPDYLADAEAEDEEVNFSDLGIQLTRSARALKVWMSVTLFGAAAFRSAIDASLDLAQLAEARVREHPELELLSPAQLGIVCFRRRFPGGDDAQDAHNAALVRAFAASGRGLVSSTRLARRLRDPPVRAQPREHGGRRRGDARVARDRRRAARPARHRARDRPPGRAPGDDGRGGVGRRRRAAGARGRAAVRRRSTRCGCRCSAAGARAEARTRGEAVVRRFESGRDFYVILAGRAEVHVGDRVVRELEPGEFFGELAALDWGADYGYPRLATVVAASDLRLAKLSAATLRELMRDVPAIDARDPPRRERAARDREGAVPPPVRARVARGSAPGPQAGAARQRLAGKPPRRAAAARGGPPRRW